MRSQLATSFRKPLAAPSLPTSDVVDFRGYFRVETFAPGHAIYREGAPADKLYMLRAGRVRLVDGKARRRQVHAILRPGDFFGDVLRAEGATAEETAIAIGKCEVWSIEGRDFRTLIEGRPALAIDVIRTLGTRVRELGRRVRALTRKDVPARLAETLLTLWQQLGEYEGEELCLHGITQQDLADLVGASRSFVSTLINEMKRDGLIEARGRVLVLKNEPGLTERSNVAAQR
jgi:CRP/FNR family cyclic AMP-dependent transcriptional regulator